MIKHRITIKHPSIIKPFTMKAAADLHIGAAHAKSDTNELLCEISKNNRSEFTKTKFLACGDIYDVTGCRSEQFFSITASLESIKHMKEVSYIRGNHEAINGFDLKLVDHLGTVSAMGSFSFSALHGHRVAWKRKKCEKWESKGLEECGVSNFRYKINEQLSKIRSAFNKNRTKKFSKKELARLDKLMDCDSQVVVCGHYHVFGWGISERGNIIISMPMGYNDIQFIPSMDCTIKCEKIS